MRRDRLARDIRGLRRPADGHGQAAASPAADHLHRDRQQRRYRQTAAGSGGAAAPPLRAAGEPPVGPKRQGFSLPYAATTSNSDIRRSVSEEIELFRFHRQDAGSRVVPSAPDTGLRTTLGAGRTQSHAPRLRRAPRRSRRDPARTLHRLRPDAARRARPCGHPAGGRGARQGAFPRRLLGAGAGRVRRRDAAAALLLVRGRRRGVPRGAPGRSRLHHDPLGRGAEPADQSLQPAHRGQSPQRARAARRGEAPRRARRARSRLCRGALARLRRRRHGPAPRPPRRLPRRDGAAAPALPRRRRGGDPIRAGARRRRLAERQDLRRPAPRERDPGARMAAPAGPSRRRPLPDPPLRLPAAGRARHPRRRALRRPGGGSAARAAHAVPHLHPRRPVGVLDRDQPARGRPGGRGGRPGAGVPRLRLHGLRLSPDRAGRGGAAHDGRGRTRHRAGAQRASRSPPRRCRRATRWNAAPGRRRRR